MSKEKDPDEVVERDPTGKGIHEKGAKGDAGKPDLSLLVLFGRALSEVGRLGTAGAKKYSRGGCLEVTDGYNRYTAAMLRHLFKESYEDFDLDPELLKYLDEPTLHATAVAWCGLCRLEMLLREKEENGRQRDS